MAAVRSPHGQHRRLAAGARRAEARARSGRGPSRDRRDASARGLVTARTAAALRRRELGAAEPCRRRDPATSRPVQSARDPGAASVSGRHLWPCGFSLPAGAQREAARGRRVVVERRPRPGRPSGPRLAERDGAPVLLLVAPPPRDLPRGGWSERLVTLVRSLFVAAATLLVAGLGLRLAPT